MRRLLFLLLIGVTLVTAQTISIDHQPQKIIIQKNGDFDRIEYAGLSATSELYVQPGAPALPVYVYSIILHPGERIASFKIRNLQQTEWKGTFNIAPRQNPWSQFSEKEVVAPDPQIYHSHTPYPRNVVKFLGVQHFNGHPIAHFAIWPVQYLPAQKKLLFTKHLELVYSTGQSDRPAVQPFAPEDQRVNPTGFSAINGVAASLPLPPPTDAIDPDLLSSGLIDRYVIIALDSLQEALQPLAEWKTQRGVPTVIRTLSWIRQNFRGVDDAERMRNFIRWSYQKRGTKYVLLAGDTPLIPTRMIYTGNFSFAADYYFSDLDGSWNANQNNTFGQAKDEVEGYPEVYVGRIPISNAREIHLFISKLFRYEKLDSVKMADFPSNVLYFAADLSKVNDSRDLIMKNIDPVINPSFKRTLLTQTDDIGSNVQVPLDALNRSYGIIFSEGHGIYYTYRPGASGSDLYNYHLAELTTPDPGIWYMASCYTNDITKRCFGEDWMLSRHGGGVAYIGNSSWEYPFSGIYLEKEFFNLAFNKEYYHLSEAHYLSRLPYLNYLNFEGPSRIIVFSTIVLGDPEMPIWTAKPALLKYTKTFLTEPHSRVLRVTVQKDDSASAPVPNAYVVLYKKDRVYRIKRTDASGTARFDVTGLNQDDVTLTVWARNFRPRQETISLIPEDGFAARLSNFRFEEVQGNGNNRCEPGEQFNLFVTWQNTGSVPIQEETVISLHDTSSLYSLGDTTFVLDKALNPGESFTAGPISCQIVQGIASDTTLTIPVMLSTPSDISVRSQVEFSVFVPHLIIAAQEWGSLAGNQNVTLLLPTIQNIGRGTANEIVARLSLLPGDSLNKIHNDSLYLPALAPGETAAFSDNFSVELHQPLDSCRFLVTFRDRSGLQWSFPIDLVQPAPPADLHFQTNNENGILLSWPASEGSDILGYYIYRAQNIRSDFEKITSTPVPLAGYFIDSDVQSGQSYYYLIRAVDSSGNISAGSDTIRAWAALPYQQGFPVRPNVKAIGSEVSGVTCYDFDGDGIKELVASGGNGQLHVYTPKGKLLFGTPGMVGDLTFPAVGNVTGDARKEIVVSSFKEGQAENNVYVIDSQTGHILMKYELGYNAPSPVVLADLNHDGHDEILILTHAGNAPEPPKESRLFILTDSSGILTHLKTWPAEGYVFENDKLSLGNLAVADLEGNGTLSVIVPTLRSKVFCFKPDSTSEPVWTQTLSGYLMAPTSVGDINLDGQLEIVVPSVKSDLLFVLNAQGQPLPGWEGGKPCRVTDPYGHSSPAILANVDGTPDLEIIYVGRDSIYIFKGDGSHAPGWPKAFFNGEGFYESDRENLSPYNSPVVGDVNQDGIQELIILDTDGYLHALRTDNGEEVAGFPIFTNNDRVNAQSPVIDDIDGDGDLDLLTVTHEGVLMVWDAPAQYSESTYLLWNQPLANVQHTGLQDTLHLHVVSGFDRSDTPKIPARFYLRPNYPNPFNPTTTIIFGLKEPAVVRLEVYNVLGQKVATLFNDKLLNSGVHRTVWNGRNQQGLELASGIYFLNFTVRTPASRQIRFVRTQKMIKLK